MFGRGLPPTKSEDLPAAMIVMMKRHMLKSTLCERLSRDDQER